MARRCRLSVRESSENGARILVVIRPGLCFDAPVMGHRTLLITGTDTGVGKTVLTCLLTRYLRQAGRRVAALKPLCSGGRSDALALHRALGGGLSLDQINPWHFRAALAPLVAARIEGKRVVLSSVLRHIREFRRGYDITLVEGAGGLLSPLGEGFNARDLVVGLRAKPVVVCPNRLGAVNQALLVIAALPAADRARADIVLVNPPTPGRVSRSNAAILGELIGAGRVHVLPWLKRDKAPASLGPRLEALWRGLRTR